LNPPSAEKLATGVDAHRIARRCLELVEQPSPTGDTSRVAELFAERLSELGLQVELRRSEFPRAPTLIATLAGDRPGPHVVLNGHLDTVPIDHEPPRLDDQFVWGRGSADMKGGLACAAELASLLAVERRFPGRVSIVAIGLHEAPGGRGEDLEWLLASGVLSADAAIVCEAASRSLPLAQMGCAIFELVVRRQGPAVHELTGLADRVPNPIVGAATLAQALETENARLSAITNSLTGPETFFIGELHGGDFYNRVPVESRLVGTRRWIPGRSFAAVEAELRELVRCCDLPPDFTVDIDLSQVRPSYEISADHDLVVSLRHGYRSVTGRDLPLTGNRVVADGSIFAGHGIPAVYHGPEGEGAHADVERVPIAELERATKVYLYTLSHYWARPGLQDRSTVSPNPTTTT
jgi:acetylornithine deacetylase/succinyl-diaminopimelate desuccinylase-like protein